MKELSFLYGFFLALLQEWFLPTVLFFVVVALFLGIYLVKKREER